MGGLLNKVNAFINYIDKPSYYFEYLYIYFEKPENILDKTKVIKCCDKNYEISCFDNFNSNNRIRFNILNMPIQNDIKEYLKNNSVNLLKQTISNSILVCETFNDNKQSNIYGIFDIKEIIINRGMILSMKNINYDSLYYIIGGIYEELKDDKMDDIKALEFLNKNKNIFEKVSGQNFFYCLNINNEITNSELKTRIGILICHYIKMYMKNKIFRKLLNLRNIQSVIQKIESIKER